MLPQIHMRCAGLDRRHWIMFKNCVGGGVGVAAGDVNTVQSERVSGSNFDVREEV